MYSGIAPRPGTSIGGGLPLNNGCSRVVNHFAPSTSSKKHVNIERDKLGVAGSNPAAAANHYQGEDTEEDEHERGNYTYNCFHYSFCDSLNFYLSKIGENEKVFSSNSLPIFLNRIYAKIMHYVIVFAF